MPRSRWARTLLLSVLIGLLCGLSARGLESLVDFGFPRLIGRVVDPTGASGPALHWRVLLLPTLGGLISGLVVAFLCRPTRAHGTAILIEAFHHGGAEMALRDAALKAVAAAAVIACGGSVGKEAAIAVLCAAIGTTVCHKLGGAVRERRIFLAAGCAAGVGAIFQTPLGGALFAASVLYSEPEFEVEALMPAFIASVTSYSTFMAFGGYGHRLLSGTERLSFQHPLELIPYAVLACLCAATSAFFYYSLRFAGRLRKRTKLPRWSAAAAAGLLCGLLALALPQIMDARYRFIQGALDGSLGPPPVVGWALCFVLVVLAKCVATAGMMSAESAGGLFGPVVFLGGVAGAATGSLFHLAWPHSFPETLRAGLIPVGMAGVLAASLRTPLAAIVMVTEMTGSYGLIVPLMLVSVAAYAMGHRFGVYAEQVRTPEESPAHAGDAVRGFLESRRVRSLLRRDWPHTTNPRASLPEALAQIPPGSQPIIMVLQGKRLAGFISTVELITVAEVVDLHQIVVAADIMNSRMPPLRMTDDLYTALERFRRAGIDVLPVVARDGKTFVGVLERATLLQDMRTYMADRSAAALREHAALSTIANDVQLDDLLAALSQRHEDSVVRMRVPDDAVGLSLRETDFRRRFGVYVLAIETAAGPLVAPPDPGRPLAADDTLIVMNRQPAAPSTTDAALDPSSTSAPSD